MNNQDKTPKHKRRWLRYSLRTFFVLMTVACVWLGLLVNRVNKQRDAVDWVREKGGYVYYDYQVNEDGEWEIFADEPGPDWLRERIGIDFFADVAKVEIYRFDSSDLSPLVELSRLETLALVAGQFDDLSPLKKLTRLKSLTLGGNTRDLWEIGELSNLQSLTIAHSNVSDVSPLAELTILETLSIRNAPVRDVTPLKTLTTLKELRLNEVPITDVSPLATLTNLELLSLKNTRVGDVTSLKSLTKLTRLEIDGTNVSDENLQALQRKLPTLAEFYTPDD